MEKTGNGQKTGQISFLWSFDGFGSISWPSIFFSFGSFTIFTMFFSDFQLFGLSTTEETWLVEMRIWCIKIGIVLVLNG
jgi:hypothetical protein